jgi:cobalt/nickel transport protein
MRRKNIILFIIVIMLVIIPLWVKGNAEFSGADGQAKVVITQMQPDYKPWFSSLWKPPSGEIESLLFALQAAIGAGFIGYFLGCFKSKKETKP